MFNLLMGRQFMLVMRRMLEAIKLVSLINNNYQPMSTQLNLTKSYKGCFCSITSFMCWYWQKMNLSSGKLLMIKLLVTLKLKLISMLNKKIMCMIGKLSKSDRLRMSWLFCSEINYLQMDTLLCWVKTSRESTLLNKHTVKWSEANCCLVQKYTTFKNKNKPKNSQYILMKT